MPPDVDPMGDAGPDESTDDEERYPDWWRRNVEEFRRYYPRPYEPPRFTDDELVPPIVFALEDELGVEIQLRVVDPQDGNRWEVVVDRTVVGEVDRDRHVDGYSLFYVTSEEFAELVRAGGRSGTRPHRTT